MREFTNSESPGARVSKNSRHNSVVLDIIPYSIEENKVDDNSREYSCAKYDNYAERIKYPSLASDGNEEFEQRK